MATNTDPGTVSSAPPQTQLKLAQHNGTNLYLAALYLAALYLAALYLAALYLAALYLAALYLAALSFITR